MYGEGSGLVTRPTLYGLLPDCAALTQVVAERWEAEEQLRELRAVMAAERAEHVAGRGKAARLEALADATTHEAADATAACVALETEAAETLVARREAEARLASCELSLARLSGIEAEAEQLRKAAEAAEAATARSRFRERELERQVSEAGDTARRELVKQATAFQQRLGVLSHA